MCWSDVRSGVWCWGVTAVGAAVADRGNRCGGRRGCQNKTHQNASATRLACSHAHALASGNTTCAIKARVEVRVKVSHCRLRFGHLALGLGLGADGRADVPTLTAGCLCCSPRRERQPLRTLAGVGIGARRGRLGERPGCWNPFYTSPSQVHGGRVG